MKCCIPSIFHCWNQKMICIELKPIIIIGTIFMWMFFFVFTSINRSHSACKSKYAWKNALCLSTNKLAEMLRTKYPYPNETKILLDKRCRFSVQQTFWSDFFDATLISCVRIDFHILCDQKPIQTIAQMQKKWKEWKNTRNKFIHHSQVLKHSHGHPQ